MRATRYLDRLPWPLRRAVAHGAGVIPGSCAGRLGIGLRRVRRVLSDVHQPSDHRFLAYCMSTPQAEIAKILSPDMRAATEGHSIMDDCLAHIDRRGLSGLERLQDRDLCTYLPNHNLLYLDKMGMAVGVEGRVPFLDMRLVEHAVRYPTHWKLAKRTTKVLLRQAARGVVPDGIITRPKAGFGAPYRKWLRHDLDSLWNDLTTESVVTRRGWFDHSALREARRRSQAGHVDLYMLQWAVLTLELWARRFIDQNPALESSTARHADWNQPSQRTSVEAA
jgi:asparagine synthase (glutamine-hydrolysing)